MACHRHIGFLENDHEFAKVDLDFKEVIKIANHIPGFGSYGVSCAGHFRPDEGYGTFWPVPWAHLDLAVLPEMKHIPELLELLVSQAAEDSDAYVGIKNIHQPSYKGEKLSVGKDLKPYSVYQNLDGSYIALLEMRLGDNGALDSVEDHCCSSIELEGNQEAFDKSKIRCAEINGFWGKLEKSLEAYRTKHNFVELDFSKKEFLPFR